MGYSIYKADLKKDKDEILKFWEENHTKSLSKKYEWIYEGNPAGKAIVWILRDDVSQEIVGMDVIFPRIYSVSGVEMLAGIYGDFLVSKHHRTLGPAMMIQRSIISSVDTGEVDFIYGFPNKNAEPVTKRVGFECLGETVRLVRTIKSYSILTRRTLPESLARMVAPIVDMALRICFSSIWRRMDQKYACKVIEETGDSFDTFWEELKTQHIVLGDRSASLIAWKYLKDPDDDNKIFAVYNVNNSMLRGYLIYRLDEDSVDIRDLACCKDGDALKALIANFVRHVSAYNPRSITLTLLGNDYITGYLKRFGFARAKSDGRVYIYYNKERKDELNLLGKAGNWWLMRSDEDS